MPPSRGASRSLHLRLGDGRSDPQAFSILGEVPDLVIAMPADSLASAVTGAVIDLRVMLPLLASVEGLAARFRRVAGESLWHLRAEGARVRASH